MKNLLQRHQSVGHEGFYFESAEEQKAYHDFMQAVREKDIEKAEGVKAFRFGDGATFLHKAVCIEKPEDVKVMVKGLGMDPDSVDSQGRTPLHYLAEIESRYYVDMISILISAGADINKKDDSGWTALYTAMKCSNEGVYSHLLVKGAESGESKKQKFFGRKKIRLGNSFKRAPLANYYVPAPLTAVMKAKFNNQKNVVFCISCKDSWAMNHALGVEKLARTFGIKPLFGFQIDDYLCFPKTGEAYVGLWNTDECDYDNCFLIKESLAEILTQENCLEIFNNCNVCMNEIAGQLKVNPYLDRIQR